MPPAGTPTSAAFTRSIIRNRPLLRALPSSPAHIHMNLLPRLQGQGLGTRLLDLWISTAREAGVKGVYLGANAENVSGQRFWASRGFERLAPPLVAPADRSVWFGQYL